MSENYFQHAEHYLRIVAAAQPQQPAVQPVRDQSEETDPEIVAQDPPSAERTARGDKAPRSETPEAVVDEDSPQPFIEDMPFVDEAGQLNGSAAKADAPPEEEKAEAEEEEKPRRRARGTRSRGVKRAASDAGSVETEAAPEAEKEEAPKPKRRTTRTRRTKTAKAEETNETEGVPAGE